MAAGAVSWHGQHVMRNELWGLALLALVAGCAREHAAPSEPTVLQKGIRSPAARASSSSSAGCSDEELDRRPRQVLRGSATYYADSLAGNPTASGAPYDPSVLSAAHRTLPFGTRLRVTRTDVELPPVCVTVNDRGPYAGRKRIVDLSRSAAERLEMIGHGVVPVRVEVF
jgi:rare lipoprotein A (peptidoglycan hydrolase)